MQHEGAHEVYAFLVTPSANLAGTHHEFNPVGLAGELRVRTLLILARDRKRRAVALVGAKANGAGRGEGGANEETAA